MDSLTEERARIEKDPFLKKLEELSTLAVDRLIEQNQPPAPPKPTTGENIDRLRNECGWSYDMLAFETKLDKALIWRHVKKGKGCTPKTLKFYADAFSKGLKRPVSVEEIKAPAPKLTTK